MPSVLRIATLAVPLVSFLAYQHLNSGPYLNTACALTGLYCPERIPVHGFAEKEFQDTYNVFVDNFRKGYDIGAGLCVFVDGRPVIDLQAGWQDPKKGIEYTNNTLQMVFSSSKALASIIIAQLVDQGLLSYDEKIATYWPEFAQGKKENVTVSDLMRHMSGVGALDHPLSLENITDSNVFANILASQPHNFDGVPTHAYHAITQGWYQNEIIRRVTGGKTIDDFAREFKVKYGSEWYFKPDATEGVDLDRISLFYERPITHQLVPLLNMLLNPFADRTLLKDFLNKESLLHRTITNANVDQVAGVMNNGKPIYRSIEGPSYSGHTNAKSMAKLVAMLANKGKAIVPGEPDLFSEKVFEEATTYIGNERDAVFSKFPMYNLKGGLLLLENHLFCADMDEDSQFVGGIGAGGSLMIYNEKYNVAIGYVTNGYMEHPPPHARTTAIINSILKIVKDQEKK